jgi:hypothetical protein
MNNFSISKKLSHNDAYICHTKQKFKFEFNEIFARKPLKKIFRNGISKYLRIAVAKIIMKYQLPNVNDVLFVFILCFHQLCFLYYAQMNSENNYLRYISESERLTMTQKFIKTYSKSLSLLVKVNHQYIHQTYQFSLRILEFLFRLQISQVLKSYLIHKSTKKEMIPLQQYRELYINTFYRVSFPTLILYIVIVSFNKGVCMNDSDRFVIVFITYRIGCEWVIFLFEKAYVVYFIF